MVRKRYVDRSLVPRFSYLDCKIIFRSRFVEYMTVQVSIRHV
jgi:hypothetical protein